MPAAHPGAGLTCCETQRSHPCPLVCGEPSRGACSRGDERTRLLGARALRELFAPGECRDPQRASALVECGLEQFSVVLVVENVVQLGPEPIQAREMPGSLLRFDRVSMTGNVLQLVWQGGSNAIQIVQCSSNLDSGWRDWLTNRPPTPVTNTWSQTNFAQTNRLFFRFKAHR